MIQSDKILDAVLGVRLATARLIVTRETDNRFLPAPKCYCAVGALLAHATVPDAMIAELQEAVYDEEDGDSEALRTAEMLLDNDLTRQKLEAHYGIRATPNDRDFLRLLIGAFDGKVCSHEPSQGAWGQTLVGRQVVWDFLDMEAAEGRCTRPRALTHAEMTGPEPVEAS